MQLVQHLKIFSDPLIETVTKVLEMSKHSKILVDRNVSLEKEMVEMHGKLDCFRTENRDLRQMVTKAEYDRQSALATCSDAEKQLEGEKKKVGELLKSNEALRALFTKVKDAMDKGGYKTS
jgi:regulator of replication initiation timing